MRLSMPTVYSRPTAAEWCSTCAIGSPMEEALAAVFPQTTLQTCIVHLLRQSLEFANWKQRKPLAAALRAIYTAPSADAALAALDDFERQEWGQRFPTIVAAWRRAWARVIPF